MRSLWRIVTLVGVMTASLFCLINAQPGVAGTSVKVLAPAPASTAGKWPAKAQLIPTVYEAGHFYAVPRTTDGQQLKLIVDTGGGGFGGMYWITANAARRLRLATRTCESSGQKFTVANLPKFLPDHGLPISKPGPCGPAVLVLQVGGVQARLAGDGQLGTGYLPGHIWTFDYAAHRLLLENKSWRHALAAHVTPLGFQRDKSGRLTTGFARIGIRIDGQALNMLLDTGATAYPTEAGEKTSGTPTRNGLGVTSYIAATTFDRWHKQHPDWRVVKGGDDLLGPNHPMRLIEVPAVEIAGWSVGPVWFTERPNGAFYGRATSMSSMLDKQVYGAVGANIFRHFVMTIDYPHATAYFRCVRTCEVVAAPPSRH